MLQTAMAHPYLVMRYRLDGVVDVVDAVNGDATLDAHIGIGEAGRGRRPHRAHQDRSARRAGTARGKDSLIARLRALNPAAPILDAAAGEATPARLLACGLFDPDREDPRRQALARRGGLCRERERSSPPPRREPRTTTASGPSRSPPRRAIPAAMLEMFLELLRSLHGPDLLRLKGIVKLAETPDKPDGHPRRAAHPAPGGAVAALARRRRALPASCSSPAISNRRRQAPCSTPFSAPAPGRADTAALFDNPLVPFGGRDR